MSTSGGVYASQSTVSWVQELQSGKPGFAVVCVNTVAVGVFATNLAIYSGLLGAVSLSCSAVILPSMALFGVANYMHYITKPLEMGLGFALAAVTVNVDPKTGIWDGAHAEWGHFYEARLSEGLATFFTQESALSIVDLGCGMGDYVRDLTNKNFRCDGYDGNPRTPAITRGACKVADLTNPETVIGEYGWVMSLEVGEHLPKQHEGTFLDHVSGHARHGIVLSWAKKGQGGLGHVNEQDNDYIQAQMAKRGWRRDFTAEDTLRLSTSPHCFWFRDTVMVYRKQNIVA